MARVDVLWGDEYGTLRVARATLEDTSHGGMSVRMKNAIRVGSHVTVKWGSEQDSGTVANCRKQKADCILGIQQDAGEGRDQEWYATQIRFTLAPRAAATLFAG